MSEIHSILVNKSKASGINKKTTILDGKGNMHENEKQNYQINIINDESNSQESFNKNQNITQSSIQSQNGSNKNQNLTKKNQKTEKEKQEEEIERQKLIREQQELERQIIIEERNHLARNQISLIDSRYFKQKFEQNGVEISKLSKTKYQFMLDDGEEIRSMNSLYEIKQDKQIKKTLIMALPELGNKINQRVNMPFISTDNASYINKNIISTIEEEQQNSIMTQKSKNMLNSSRVKISHLQTPKTQGIGNRKQKYQLNDISSSLHSSKQKHSQSQQNLGNKLFSAYSTRHKRNDSSNIYSKNSLERNLLQQVDKSQFSDFSGQNQNYSEKDKVIFELVHNKSAKNALNKINGVQNNRVFQAAERNLKKNQDKVQKQPKIRVFDSKHYQKMQKIMKQKDQYEQNLQDPCAQNLKIDRGSAQKFFNLNEKKSPRLQNMEISNKNGTMPKIVYFEENNVNIKRDLQDLVQENQQNHVYQAFNLGISQNHWRPMGREYCALAVIDKKAYLYGGSTIRDTNEICIQDVNSLKWEVIKNQKGEIPKSYRYSHQMVAHKKDLYILGGYQNPKDTSNNNTGECIMDVKVFNTETLTWKSIHLFGELIQPRRNFCCCIHGKTIIVHGGIDNWGNFFNDTWLFDIPTSRWSEAQTSTPISKAYQKGIGYHSSCNVYNQERKMPMVYKQLEKIDGRFSGIKQEGIYFFGGKKQIADLKYAELQQIMIDGKDDGDRNEVVGELMILKIDTKPFQWIQPETKGQRPSPRFSCSMVYNHQTENIFVYGGQNDNMIQMVFLNDLYVLKLSNLEWQKVNLYNGENVPSRTGHSAFSFDSKLYIFGGINFNGFCSSETLVVELDEREAYLSIKDDLQNKAMKQMQIQIQNDDEVNDGEKNDKKNKKPFKPSIVNNIINMSKSNMSKSQTNEQSKIKERVDLKDDKFKRLMFDNAITYNPLPIQQSIAELRSNKSSYKSIENKQSQPEKQEKSLFNILGKMINNQEVLSENQQQQGLFQSINKERNASMDIIQQNNQLQTQNDYQYSNNSQYLKLPFIKSTHSEKYQNEQ